MTDLNVQLAKVNGTDTLLGVGALNHISTWDHTTPWPYTQTIYTNGRACNHCWCSKTVQGSEDREHPKCCKCSEVGSIVPHFKTEGR